MVAPRGTGQLVRSMVRIPGSGSDRLADPVSLDLSNVSSLAAMVPVPQRLPRNLYRSNSSLSTEAVGRNYENRLTEAAVKPIPKETPAENKPKATEERKRSVPEDVKEVNETSSLPAPKVARVELKSQVQVVRDSKEAHQQVLIFPSASGTVIQIPIEQMSTAVLLPQQQSQVANISLSIVVPQLHQLETNAVLPQSGLYHTGSIDNKRSSPATPLQQREMPQAASTSSTTQGHHPVNCELFQEVNKLKKEREALMERLTKFQNIFKNKQSLQYIARRLAESSAQT